MLVAQQAPVKGIRAVLATREQSSLALYRQLTIGDAGFFALAAYELANLLLLPFPGALGLMLRRIFLRKFFGHMGQKVVIGRNCVFRHPRGVFLGDSVVIDDNCVLDARGCGAEGLRIEAESIVNRGCIIQSKSGPIRIGSRVSVGAGSHLVSWSGLDIGNDVAIAGGCHISAGSFPLRELGKPAASRKPVSAGAICIEDGAWLATGAVVLDAVSIGANAVVSAGSVVTQSVPPLTVVQGNPAKRIFVIR